MSEKKRSDARAPGEEILDRAAQARPSTPQTPLTGASKATAPPRPRKRAVPPPGSRGRRAG